MSTTTAPKQPGRAVLRLAAVFTQLTCAMCLLLGTIAFVLIQQGKLDGTALAIVWATVALVGLVLGGLMPRGGLLEVIGGALIDASFGITLLVLDYDDLRSLLRILPEDDVETVADVLVGAGGAMLATSLVCFAAIPQALRYTRWLNSAPDESEAPMHLPASSTAPGFPPPPISAMKGSVWHMPAQPGEDTPSRRRIYFMLAGFAIGLGAGVGVLVSSSSSSSGSSSSSTSSSTSGSTPDAAAQKPEKPDDKIAAAPVDAGAEAPVDAAIKVASQPVDAGVTSPTPPDAPTKQDTPPTNKDAAIPTLDALVAAQRAAITRGDADALAALAHDKAFSFGVEADEVAEGRAAIAAQLARDLDLGGGSASVSSRFKHVGQTREAAWIAEELDIAPRGKLSRKLAVTTLAVLIDKRWTVVAWCWAKLVSDADAERVTQNGTKPRPKPVANTIDGPKDFDTAVRAAFASWRGFVDARSVRSDGFNFGSAPNERSTGGGIKSMFSRMGATLALRDGAVRAAAAGAWDAAQKDPQVGFAAANVDLTLRASDGGDMTQSFRVLAVVVKEGGAWKIVQTQWSHGGPIR